MIVQIHPLAEGYSVEDAFQWAKENGLNAYGVSGVTFVDVGNKIIYYCDVVYRTVSRLRDGTEWFNTVQLAELNELVTDDPFQVSNSEALDQDIFSHPIVIQRTAPMVTEPPATITMGVDHASF